MHLMYTIGAVRVRTNEDGKRLYTLKKVSADGKMTKSAHPGASSLTSALLA